MTLLGETFGIFGSAWQAGGVRFRNIFSFDVAGCRTCART